MPEFHGHSSCSGSGLVRYSEKPNTNAGRAEWTMVALCRKLRTRRRSRREVVFVGRQGANLGSPILNKILARAGKKASVAAGDLVIVDVDTVVLYDSNFF